MAKFSDIRRIDNGAKFYNADLHIHTHLGSSDVSDADMTPQNIVESAVRQGISIIAITDHNSDRNVATTVELAKEYIGALLVLAGVEVTTAHGHLLVYFNPEEQAALHSFLIKLDLSGEMGAENTRTAKSMSDTISLAHSYGAISVAAHIDRTRTGFEMFASGFQNWKRDIITAPGLYGLEYDDYTKVDWYSDEEEGSTDAASRRPIYSAREEIQDLQGRHELARLQGSDSHTLRGFENSDLDKRWTRIKLSELSWEAFKTAMVDPTARIRATAALPRDIPRITGIALQGGFLGGENIHFSRNLNCFIGGRGTGKSTAIRALAYGFGTNEEFADYDNCPDLTEIFCEGGDGIIYKYSRARHGDIKVSAKENGEITSVPIDSFRVEYFGQGHLAEVAKDPLNSPQLFQDFLDRHTDLSALKSQQQHIIENLRENATRLQPLEQSRIQTKDKRSNLDDANKKIKIAEEGNLKEIVKAQNKLAAEKTIRQSVSAIAARHSQKFDLDDIKINFEAILDVAGEVTGDPDSVAPLNEVKEIFSNVNNFLEIKAAEIAAYLAESAKLLEKQDQLLRDNHFKLEGELLPKITDLKEKGLAGNLDEINSLLVLKGTLSKQIAELEQKAPLLERCRQERADLLAGLKATRTEMSGQRKKQLLAINRNLATTLTDYTIFVKYEEEGIIDEFHDFLKEKLSGSYMQDSMIKSICSKMRPDELSQWVRKNQSAELEAQCAISGEWSQTIFEKLRNWRSVFELQVLSKPPKPVIVVKSKSTPHHLIPVKQLSDGQRHTILLTIALLADTNVPLIIDQPEDDLDNAFISSSIVATLRSIKEKRQVIVVTHNANIAVLGDSEMILPMIRENDKGTVSSRGSIDSQPTKLLVQNILEGGKAAFVKRRKIYGH